MELSTLTPLEWALLILFTALAQVAIALPKLPTPPAPVLRGINAALDVAIIGTFLYCLFH